jgi:hypothetical protein
MHAGAARADFPALKAVGVALAASRSKEISEKGRRLRLPYSAIDLGSVMAGRGREEAHAALDSPALLVEGAEIEPSNPRERDCRSAHRAGFERDVKIALREAFAFYGMAGVPERNNLRMRRRIASRQNEIVPAAKDFS